MAEDLPGEDPVSISNDGEAQIRSSVNPLLSASGTEGATWAPTPDDLRMLRAILWPVIRERRPAEATWPTWDYVRRSAKRDPGLTGRSPEEIIDAFPHVRDGTRQGYGLIWRSDHFAGQIRPEERVGLTIAGLHIADPGSADALVQLAASYAGDESLLQPSPTGVVEGYANFERADWMLERRRPLVGAWKMTVPAAAEVLLHEHPPLISQSGPGEWVAHLGPTDYETLAGITTAQGYLAKLWDRIRPLNEGQVQTMSSTQDKLTKVAESPNPRQVFVIHGRNETARKGLFDFLRSIGLSPIEWSHAIHKTGKASPYIGEVLDAAFGAAQAVVVLETPDDIAYLHQSLTYPDDPECEAQAQPRPNVLFEAGMAMGRNPDRTIIVELGRVKVFSDIHGRHVVRLDNTVAKRQDLAQRLQTAGCAVDLSGSDWHTSGNLTPPTPPGGGLPMGRKLPSTKATGIPRLDAKYIDRGRNMEEIEVTNHGPGDVYELDVTANSADDMIVRSDELPVPKLPQGKSVRVMRIARTLASRTGSYLYLTATAKTVDGMPIDDQLFVSGL